MIAFRGGINLKEYDRSVFQGGDGGEVYAKKLVNIYGASEGFRLTDILSGTVITAQVSSARNGTLSGWTLQNAVSPIANETLLAPLSDGINDFGNIYSLNSIFDGATGSIVAWVKLLSSTEATNGVAYRAVSLAADADNRVGMAKATTNQWSTFHEGSNVIVQITSALPAPDANWHMIGLSWVNGSKTFASLDESQFSTDGAAPNTFTGSLTSTLCAIGAIDTTPTASFKGWLCHVYFKFGTAWTPTDFANIYAARLG